MCASGMHGHVLLLWCWKKQHNKTPTPPDKKKRRKNNNNSFNSFNSSSSSNKKKKKKKKTARHLLGERVSLTSTKVSTVVECMSTNVAGKGKSHTARLRIHSRMIAQEKGKVAYFQTTNPLLCLHHCHVLSHYHNSSYQQHPNPNPNPSRADERDSMKSNQIWFELPTS